MKARLLTFLLFLTVMMMAAPQVSALDIRVLSNGRIEFYSGSVLGDEDGQKKDENKQGDERKEDKKEEYKQENRIRTINGNGQELRIRSKEDKFEVELRDKTEANKYEFKKVERMEANQVNIKFPAELNEKREKLEDLREANQEKLEDHREANQEYREKLREERKTMTGETLEIKNKLKEKKQVLELKSRNVKANLENGASFNLDADTNQVTVTTPAGEEHVLNHLPQQAIDRMFQAGFYDGNDETQEEISVETSDNGELFYSKRGKIKKKLFGLFPREIDSEIILNDATGEVTQHETNSSSIFEQFFNKVSF